MTTADAAARLVDALRRRHASLAVAESLTGGLLALRVTQTPDSGEVFRGGVVAYLTGVKHELLDVPEGPVVSAACAEAMAAGVAAVLGADVGLSTTGVAGPTTQEGQEVGTVFLGFFVDGARGSSELHLPSDASPDDIREATVRAALTQLAARLDITTRGAPW